MKKNINISTGKKAILHLLILASLGFLGCSTVGQVVPVDKQISFSETGKSRGNYSYGACTVGYNYSLAGGNMSLDGMASYRGGFDSLDVRVLFLDGAGTVLQQKLVYSSGYRTSGSRDADPSFQKALVVPPGSAGISFSCSTKERSNRR